MQNFENAQKELAIPLFFTPPIKPTYNRGKNACHNTIPTSYMHHCTVSAFWGIFLSIVQLTLSTSLLFELEQMQDHLSYSC